MDRDWASGRARSGGRDAASDIATPGKQTGMAAAETRATAGPMPYPNASPLGEQLGGRGERAGGGAAAGAPHSRAGAGHGITHTTVSPDVPDRTRTRVGVGEEVDFTAAGDSAGTWTASASIGTPNGSGETFRWRAPDVAGPVMITHEHGGRRTPVEMDVVAPTAVHFRKTQDDPQMPAGVGMWTQVTFDPTGVSWQFAQWQEKGYAEAGAPQNPQGYFAEYLQRPGARPLVHEPNTAFTGMSTADGGISDHAFIGGKPRVGSPPRWYEGSFSWSIPNVYRVAGQTAEHPIETVTQTFTMQGGTNAGAMTVTKKEATATQMASGQMLNTRPDMLERLETPDAAQHFLRGYDDPKDAIKAALTRLSNYRANDRPSYDNLLAAVRAYSRPVYMYVAIRCVNKFSYVLRDDVALTMTGHNAYPQSFSLGTGEFRDFSPLWTTIIDPATFNGNDLVHYRLVVEGREFLASQAFPFNELNQVEMPGSGGHYQINSFLSSQAARG